MKKKRKPVINWQKALKKSLSQEEEKDAREIVECVRKLYWLLIAKRNQ